MSKKLKIILNQVDNQSVSTVFTAEILENKNLNIGRYDSGSFIESTMGSGDHEHDITIKSDNKDQLLLELLKDKFHAQTESDVEKWLDQKKIPYTNSCWF